MHLPAIEETLATLALNANAADGRAVWPHESWEALRQSGVLGWCIPSQYGGSGLGPVELLAGYERLAGACLTTCFILSQRDAAVRRIRDSDNERLCRELLPPLARGDAFATVGLSQLTTSRQYTKPALAAREQDTAIVLDGFMPWVTGASESGFFITGAVLDDGRQVLAALPADSPGITVETALELMALEGSLTAEVRCRNVRLERRWLLAGPADKVLASGRGGAGGLETSCLALGLAGAAIDYLAGEANSRPELRKGAEQLEKSRQRHRQEMFQLVEGVPTAEAAATLRARANSLVLRATQAALTASKGAGFLRSHPAQRWARQALFFLVWSCPRPAADAMLSYFSSPGEDACP
jgi:butyryl-CoA dehydrogenase